MNNCKWGGRACRTGRKWNLCVVNINNSILGGEGIKTRFQGKRLKTDCLYTPKAWSFCFVLFLVEVYRSISVYNNSVMSRKMNYIVYLFMRYNFYTSRMDWR